MANVRVKINNPGAIADRLEGVFWKKGYPVVREVQKADCNTYVRKQDGMLASSISDGPGKNEISWETPYAQKVYYTGTPRKNKNPNASLRWCEVAKRKYSHEWAEIATKQVNGG